MVDFAVPLKENALKFDYSKIKENSNIVIQSFLDEIADHRWKKDEKYLEFNEFMILKKVSKLGMHCDYLSDIVDTHYILNTVVSLLRKNNWKCSGSLFSTVKTIWVFNPFK